MTTGEHHNRSGARRPGIAALLAVFVAWTAVGCSSGPDPSSVTCDDYARADFKQQGEIQRALLKAHGLDGGSIDNAAGLTGALEDACGWESSNHKLGHAAKNGSRRLDDLINWKSGKW